MIGFWFGLKLADWAEMVFVGLGFGRHRLKLSLKPLRVGWKMIGNLYMSPARRKEGSTGDYDLDCPSDG